MVQAHQLGARRRRLGTALSSGSAAGALVTCNTAGSRLPTARLWAGLSSTPPRAAFLPVDTVPRPILPTIVTARTVYLRTGAPSTTTSGAAPTRRRSEIGTPRLARSKLDLVRSGGQLSYSGGRLGDLSPNRGRCGRS